MGGRAGGWAPGKTTRKERGCRVMLLGRFEGARVTESYRGGRVTQGEVGRWVDGMSRGSVLMAGGGLSSKNKKLHT